MSRRLPLPFALGAGCHERSHRLQVIPDGPRAGWHIQAPAGATVTSLLMMAASSIVAWDQRSLPAALIPAVILIIPLLRRTPVSSNMEIRSCLEGATPWNCPQTALQKRVRCVPGGPTVVLSH